MMSSHYVQVAPAIPLPAHGPQVYTYQLTNEQRDVAVNTAVQVPLGRRTVSAVVLRHESRRPPYRTRPVLRVTGPAVTDQQVELARWIADTAHGGLGFTLRLFLPSSKVSDVISVDLTTPTPSPTFPSVYVEGSQARRFRHIASLLKQQLQDGGQALLLVPELRFIDEHVRYLKEALPDRDVSAVHSEQTGRAHADNWLAIKRGDSMIIVGTQKALFLPFQHLRVVVLLEEFMTSHKLFDAYPRLDNRYGAAQLASIHHAHLAYVSSIGSLRLHYLMQQKVVDCQQWRPATKRLHPLLINKDFMDRQRHRLIPDAFIKRAKPWVKAKERIVILTNRRGQWATVMCRACQTTLRCPTCEVALMVPNEKKKQLVCQHCSRHYPFPTACPTCNKKQWRTFGAGMQRLIEVLRTNMPGIPISAIDAERVSQLSDKQLQKELKRRPNIIIGTTALFAAVAATKVDRAVFLLPERQILYPDFRSEERALYHLARLQQLTPKRHPVIVSNYPDLIKNKLMGSFEQQLDQQLRERRRLSYPPVTDLVRLTVANTTDEQAKKRARVLAQTLDKRLKDMPHLKRQGPFQSYLRRRRGKAEYHVLLMGPLADLPTLYRDLPIDTVDIAPERIL